MSTLNPFKTLVCHDCKTKQFNTSKYSTKRTKENADDEHEFKFMGIIPIAGEDDGDSQKSWGSDETEDEDVPSAMHYSINDDATNVLAFRVGPIMDGIIVDYNQVFHILVTANYYQSLADSDNTIYMFMNTTLTEIDHTPDITPARQIKRIQHSPFQHLKIKGTPDSNPSPKQKSHTWFHTRSEELQRLANCRAITTVTNAQRLAHPWKVEKRQQNKNKQARLKYEIDVTLHYVDNSTQTTPPPSPPSFCYNHSHCSIFSSHRQEPETIRGQKSQRCEQLEICDLMIHRDVPSLTGQRSKTGFTLNVTDERRCDPISFTEADIRHSEVNTSSQLQIVDEISPDQHTTKSNNRPANSVTHSHDNIPCPTTAQEDLSTYYQVFNRHRPEMGESNAESADRMRLIEEEILHIQAMRNKRKRVMVITYKTSN
jgi:hypothetical protein